MYNTLFFQNELKFITTFLKFIKIYQVVKGVEDKYLMAFSWADISLGRGLVHKDTVNENSILGSRFIN